MQLITAAVVDKGVTEISLGSPLPHTQLLLLFDYHGYCMCYRACILHFLQWMKILRYSVLVAMSSILWTLGLSLCGALRTILLWEHSEIALLAAVGAISTLSHEKVE